MKSYLLIMERMLLSLEEAQKAANLYEALIKNQLPVEDVAKLDILYGAYGRTTISVALDSLERSFEKVGQDTNRIPDEIQEKYPEIDWPNIIGLRNNLAHAYETIIPKMLINIAKHNVPKTINQLKQAIAQEKDELN